MLLFGYINTTLLNYHQRFGATRRAVFLPQKFIKSTKVSLTTKPSLEHETPPFG